MAGKNALLSGNPIKNFPIRPKKKTSLFPVAGLKIAMRNAVFLFFFYNSWKSNAQCGFYFFKQNFRKKIHQNNSRGFFSTFIKNIIPVSYQNDLCDHLFYMHSVHL